MIVYLAGLMGRHDLLLEGIRHEDISCRRKLQNTHYQPLNNNYGGNLLDYDKGIMQNLYLAGEHDNMNLYLAGEHEVKNGLVCKSWEGVNILETYFTAKNNKHIGRLINSAKNFILDSGAFTFLQNETARNKIDWDRYVSEYAEFIKYFNVRLFFELDIDSIVRIKEVERLRTKLERLTNKQPIPVWHKNRGKQYFIDMCKNYPYVGLGGIVIKEIPVKTFESAFPWFINTAHENGTKIHGLGYTRLDNLKKYHFDSVDSTAWLYGNRGGYIFRFNTLTGVMEKHQKSGVRVKSRETAIHNFKEWIKLCNYADKNW